ncbi:HD domain-containing protein [Desulfolutivibrio sulfoxidireducens]|uniref:HD domain-containing protein n=1 Tax=Desulfolutivibrio sulfoxidireducens TaxID=2773299 RepID=UPI00159D5EA5|nr:HD domain-containing protein [Desulfolutivibrio sulfoxidireducens]QLA16538.1 HD domain-containing protein [Desulfolutivibrio sulfoxidireducens]
MLERFMGMFSSYVDGYLTGDPLDVERLALKRDHSLRVLDEARMITQAVGITGELAESIHVAALLHDVGRFPQYAAHRTFRDAVSVNHARLGTRVLRRMGMLAHLPPRTRSLILGAIIMHNRLALPRAVAAAAPDDPLSLAARVVRDADKLDILRVMVEHFDQAGGLDEVVTMGLPERPGDFSPELVEPIMRGRVGYYQDMRCINDLRLLLISWLHDFNFPASVRAVFHRGLLVRLFAGLPSAKEITSARERVFRLAPCGENCA